MLAEGMRRLSEESKGGGLHVTGPAPGVPIVITDNADTDGVAISGDWETQKASAGCYKDDYLCDQNAGKGKKDVRITPDLSWTGLYEIYIWYPAHAENADSVPIDITCDGHTDTIKVNQTMNGSRWNYLGMYRFEPNKAAKLLIRTDGTKGKVVVDAFKFVPME